MADVKVHRTIAGSWFYRDRSFGLFWSPTVTMAAQSCSR